MAVFHFSSSGGASDTPVTFNLRAFVHASDDTVVAGHSARVSDILGSFAVLLIP